MFDFFGLPRFGAKHDGIIDPAALLVAGGTAVEALGGTVVVAPAVTIVGAASGTMLPAGGTNVRVATGAIEG